MKLLEWFFSHRKVEPKTEIEPSTRTIIEPGTTQIVDDLPVGYYQASVDTHGVGKRDGTKEEIIKSLLTRYRKMELITEVDDAVDTIVNEMIVPDDEENIVEIDLKKCELPDKISEKISDIFNNKVLSLLNFNSDAYDIVRKWYVDGRIHYNISVDAERLSKGIKKLIYIDSYDIFLQKEMKNKNEYKIYYKFYNRDLGENFEVNPDLIIYVGSNKFDRVDGVNPVEVSYLSRAFKPLNDFVNIKDSIVIYRLVRAPEKRIFIVNTGMLNKTKSEEYMQKLINKMKNQLVYNSETGEVNVYKTHHSMVEDFWFPENAEGKGTKVDTLPGGEGLKNLDDLYFFDDKFYDALRIPQSRRNTDRQRERSMFNTNAEIERDEIVFFKMIQRLRKQFSKLFIEILKKELIWTKVLGKNDFDKIKNKIIFKYNNDNMYEELKQSAILNNRMNTLTMVQPYIGKFYTINNVAYDILKFTEEEWKEKEKDFKKNKEKYDKFSIGEEQFGGGYNPSYKNQNFDKTVPDTSSIVNDDEEEKKKDNEDDEV